MSPALAGGFLTTVPPGKSPLKGFRRRSGRSRFMLQSILSSYSVERVGGIKNENHSGDYCTNSVPVVVIIMPQ